MSKVRVLTVPPGHVLSPLRASLLSISTAKPFHCNPVRPHTPHTLAVWVTSKRRQVRQRIPL
jgi:hypothetical protein